MSPPANMEPEPEGGEILVNQTSIGNEADVQVLMELGSETTLFIRSVGEITRSGRYDYGWIRKQDTGEIVWEMTLQNTMPAGGDERNRLYQGTLTLPAGTYLAAYESDLWHAYEDFGEIPPENPSHWGLFVKRVSN